MTEACSGVTGPLAAVSWYRVPNVTKLAMDDVPDVTGYWSQTSNRIVLVAADTIDGGLVRHEMLHALLGTPEHPRAKFLGSCAGVVDCTRACAADAGPPPTVDSTLRRVPPESIEVTARLEPSTPNVSSPSTYFTISVSARNPASHAVSVTLPPYSLAGDLDGFSFDIVGPPGGLQNGVIAIDPSSWTFEAGETKRQLFDFVVGSFDPTFGQFPPGSYVLRGAYGKHWSGDTPFTIGP